MQCQLGRKICRGGWQKKPPQQSLIFIMRSNILFPLFPFHSQSSPGLIVQSSYMQPFYEVITCHHKMTKQLRFRYSFLYLHSKLLPNISVSVKLLIRNIQVIRCHPLTQSWNRMWKWSVLSKYRQMLRMVSWQRERIFPNSSPWCYAETHLMGGKAEAGAPESVWADCHMRATFLQSKSQHPLRVQMHVTMAISQANQSGYQFPGLYYSHLSAAEDQNNSSIAISACSLIVKHKVLQEMVMSPAFKQTGLSALLQKWQVSSNSSMGESDIIPHHCSLLSKSKPLTYTDSTLLLHKTAPKIPSSLCLPTCYQPSLLEGEQVTAHII